MIKFRFIDRPDLAKAQSEFESACYFSRHHAKLMTDSLVEFGYHGPDVSAIGRDHFPAERKDHLRRLARGVGYHSVRAFAARPKRIRKATLIRLWREIATRDGTGFYGVAPLRESE